MKIISKYLRLGQPSFAVALTLIAMAGCGGDGGAGALTQNTIIPDAGSGTTPTHELLPACDTNPANRYYFTHNPIVDADLANFKSIFPLGGTNISGGHVFPSSHIYLNFPNDTTPMVVQMPGNMTITSITRHFLEIYDYNLNGTFDPGEGDFTIHFGPCREFLSYFGHIKVISDELLAAIAGFTTEECFGGDPTTFSHCTRQLSIPVAAGTVIGGSGNRPNNSAFDFGVRDKLGTPVTEISPNRFLTDVGFEHKYIQCPLNYYNPTGGLYATLMAKIGNYDSGTDTFTAKTEGASLLCGTNGSDIAGTAQGYWFPDTTSIQSGTTEASSMVLMPDAFYYDSKQGFNIGSAVADVGGMAYTFTHASSGRVNRNFAQVTDDGNIYCYETFEWEPGHVFLIKIEGATLKFKAISAASCNDYDPDPANWSITGATTFYR